jgi:Mn-dependent DtxR family transcriptional regulator
MQLSLNEAILVAVFRGARRNQRFDLSRLAARFAVATERVEAAVMKLERAGLLSRGTGGTSLTFPGLALAAGLAGAGARAARRESHRLLAA